MNRNRLFRRLLGLAGGACALLGGVVWLSGVCQESTAAPPWRFDGRCAGWAFDGRDRLGGPQALAGTWYNFPSGGCPDYAAGGYCGDGGPPGCDVGGSWFWMRSPEQERVVVAGLYNRYCIRCHGVDGRGVWDMPGVPDFTNARWQVSRSDDQIARIIIQGRGAVMPPFRGTLTLEEAWAMARYLRTFVPGTEASRPDVGSPEKAGKVEELPPPTKAK
jgi:mono/diheme cytochrome c family protein